MGEIGSSDEINLHIPQTVEAEAEILVNSRCAVHLVSSQGSAPVNGLVQDALVAFELLTATWEEESALDPVSKNGEFFTMVSKKIAMMIYEEVGFHKDKIQNLMYRALTEYKDYIIINEIGEYEFDNYIPGQLFASILFPEDLCYSRKTNTDERKPEVFVEDGIIIPKSGPLCKQIVGGKKDSIVHLLWKRSPELCLRFLSDAQQLTDRWLPTEGFSFGIRDCLTTNEEPIKKILLETNARVAEVLKKETDAEKIEAEVAKIFQEAMTIGNKLAKSGMMKGQRNSLNIMRNAGAKGSVINLTQITAFVGQQYIKGKRMPQQISNGTRCLPSYLPNDNSPEARGFVQNNYLKGLTPQEAYFHAAAGREGVISTAMRTAEGGYIQKRIARKVEDLKVYIDGTVRDPSGKIYSWMYGDDGMEAKKLVSVRGLDSPFFINPYILAKQINSGAKTRKEISDDEIPENLSIFEINLLLPFIRYSPIKSDIINEVTKHTHSILTKLLLDVKIYKSKIPLFFAEIKNAYINSKVPYGYAPGLIATSSMGEPTTQMILNVFHFAGVKGKESIGGVPRFKQLINATKSKEQVGSGCIVHLDIPELNKATEEIKRLEKENERNASDIQLISQNNNNISEIKKNAFSILQDLKRDLEEVCVGDFLIDTDLKYLPDSVPIPEGLGITSLFTYEEYEEEWWVGLSKDLNDIEINASSWVILLYFDVEKLYKKKMDLEDIASAIEENSKHKLLCISSPTIIGRIEVYTEDEYIREYAKTKVGLNNSINNKLQSNIINFITEDNIDYYVRRDAIIDAIKKTKITGITKISKVYPKENNLTHEFILETDGVNLLDLASNKNVDALKTISDDVHGIKALFGIEAARKVLFNEIYRVICDNNYVNPRHISILVDAMTVTGNITAASRDGISRDVGPNSKIMFEKNVDNAAIASVFTEKDFMVSLASSVMYGKLAKIGAGAVTVKTTENSATYKAEIKTVQGYSSLITSGEREKYTQKIELI